MRRRIFKAVLNRPWGLLGPCAWLTRMHGPEGAPVQQCTGATRLEEEMEELYVEGLATHGDPESCVDDP